MATTSVRKRERPAVSESLMPSLGNSSKHDPIETNLDLDKDIKRIALKISKSVVSLVSVGGDEKSVFKCSGTIIGCENVDGKYISTILTSATLLNPASTSSSDPPIVSPIEYLKVKVYLWNGNLFEAKNFKWDFYYNLASVEIESDTQLPVASLQRVDDFMSLNLDEMVPPLASKSFKLLRHSNFKLCPGETVVALARYFKEPNKIMTAPGSISLDSCTLDCKELFVTTCKIAMCGIGGPLVNRLGGFIGVNFMGNIYTPFLPNNIVLLCLERFKHPREFFRPWLGLQMTNLYAASVDKLERVIHKFPGTFEGVIVEKVMPGSPADSAGLRRGDVIIECNGRATRSFLQFVDWIWHNTGESVELSVLRETSDDNGHRLSLTVVVGEISEENFNRWQLPKLPTRVVRRWWSKEKKESFTMVSFRS